MTMICLLWHMLLNFAFMQNVNTTQYSTIYNSIRMIISIMFFHNHLFKNIHFNEFS